jgi:hypothetical protein
MSIHKIGFLVNNIDSDKKLIKKAINKLDIDKFKKIMKKIKKVALNLQWTTNEYIQAIFPKIYLYLHEKTTDEKYYQILLDNKIKLTKKIQKKLKDIKLPDLQDKSLIKLSSIALDSKGYGIRLVHEGDNVVLYMRTIDNKYLLDKNNKFIPTVGKLTRLLSKNRALVTDSLNQLLYINVSELSPTLVDVFGVNYYNNLVITAHSQLSNMNTTGITSTAHTPAYKPGNHVLMRLRKKTGELIVDNGAYVLIIGIILVINSGYYTIRDTIGNTHYNISLYELQPVILSDINNQYYLDLTKHAMDVYRKYL